MEYGKSMDRTQLLAFFKSLEVRKLGCRGSVEYPLRNYVILPEGKFAILQSVIKDLKPKIWQKAINFKATFKLDEKPVLEIESASFKYKFWLQDVKELTWHDKYEDFNITKSCKEHNPKDYVLLLRGFRYENDLGDKMDHDKSLVACTMCDAIWATNAEYTKDLKRG